MKVVLCGNRWLDLMTACSDTAVSFSDKRLLPFSDDLPVVEGNPAPLGHQGRSDSSKHCSDEHDSMDLEENVSRMAPASVGDCISIGT